MWQNMDFRIPFQKRHILRRSVDNFQNRELAKLEPTTVLEGEVPRLIDEWQEVPSIWMQSDMK